ncbi:MAG: TetR/AcrR family transcriptional regulator [Chloroflexota bacterium]
MSFGKNFEHEDKLFKAALQEFSDYGYDQASINRILDEAGMSKGQFYYHFRNKEGFYLALIGVMVAQKRDFLQNIMQATTAQNDIYSIFRARMTYELAFAREHPAVNAFGESFEREKGGEIYEKAAEQFNLNNDDLLNALIELAYQKGDFRSDIPLEFIKPLLVYIFNHAADMVDLSDQKSFDQNLSYLLSVLKSGIA